MLTTVSDYRVLYADTDQMGYFYHGNYTQLYEIGRTDMLRKIGYTYKQLEENGYILPVIKLESQFRQPALYDDELSIKTKLERLPSIRIDFSFEIFNQTGDLLCTARTEMVFADKTTKKPVKAPADFIVAINDFISKDADA